MKNPYRLINVTRPARSTGRRLARVLASVVVVLATIVTAWRATAVEIEHYVGRREAQQTKTSSGWSNVSGANIAGSNFTVGEKYLILAWGEHNTNNKSKRSGIRVMHGGSAFGKSTTTEESDRDSADYKTPYFWSTVWTAANQDLEVQYYRGGGTARVEDVTLLAINAENLIANGDLVYSENTSGGGLSTSWSTKSSITWTPANDGDTWWIMGNTRGDIVNVGDKRYQARLYIDGANQRSFQSIQGEDNSDTPLYGLGWVQTFDDTAHTVNVQIKESGTNQNWHSAGVFALRLNAFDSFAAAATAGDGTKMSTNNKWYEQQGVNPTVNEDGDWLIAAGTIFDDDDKRCQSRIQLGGSDITDVTGGWQHSAGDKVPNTVADFQEGLTASSTLNIDFDTKTTDGKPADAEDAWVVAFSMEVVPPTLGWDGGAGNWSDFNWNGGLAPQTGAHMIVDAAGNDSDVTLAADFGPAMSLSIGQTKTAAVTVNSDVTLTVERDVTVGASGSLDIQGTLDAAGINSVAGSAMAFGAGGKLIVGSGGGSIDSASSTGDLTIKNTGALAIGVFDDNDTTSTFTKQGGKALTLGPLAAASMADTAFLVNAGTLKTSGANALGGATGVTLNGGSLTVDHTSPLNLTGTDVTVAANKAGTLSAPNAAADFGALTLGNNSELTTTGADMSVAGTTLSGASATIIADSTFDIGTYDDSTGGARTLTIKGSGDTVVIDNTTPGSIIANNTTFRVEAGTLKAMGADPLGTGDTNVTLAGGELKLTLGKEPPPPRDQLVAQWKFDDGSGSTAVNSVAPGTRDGTLVNFPGDDSQWVAGKIGGALDFDGTDDYVNIGGYKGVTGSMDRTVSAWIKAPTSGADDAEIISWGQNNNGKKWIFRLQDDNGTAGAIRVEVSGGYVVGTTDLRDGQWHHVAAVLPAGQNNVNKVLLYVDGAPDGSSAVQGQSINTASSQEVRIGRGHGNYYFPGPIDEVYLYNRALSAAEIATLYTALDSVSGDMDMTDTDFIVEADSTLNAAADGSASFGSLTFTPGGPDAILTTTGAGGGISFADTAITAAGTVGFDTEADTTPGAIDGGGHAATIVKRGAASLILEAANTYAGQTQIEEGVLLLGHVDALGATSAGTTVADGGQLKVSLPSAPGVVNLGEPLTLAGAGPDGNGALYIADTNGKDIHLGVGLELAGDTTISTQSRLYVDGGIATKSGVSGRTDLTFSGSRPVHFEAATTFDGDLYINTSEWFNSDGNEYIPDSTVVHLNNGTGYGWNKYNMTETIAGLAGNGIVRNGGALILDVADGQSYNYTGVMESGSLTKQGLGTQTFSGNNTYSGATTVSAGTLKLGHGNALGDEGTGTTVQAGATLNLNGYNIGSEPLTIAGAGVGGQGALINERSALTNKGNFTLTLSGDASIGGSKRFDLKNQVAGGAYTLTKVGTNDVAIKTGTVTIGNVQIDGGALILETNGGLGNTAYGTTINPGGTLKVWSNGHLTFSEPITLAGGELRATQSDATGHQLGGTINLAAGSSIHVENDAAMTIHGVISGGGNLNVDGAGPLTLTAANTYTGATNLNAGTLLVEGSIAGSSGVTVAAGATLAGTGTVSGTTIESGGSAAPGASPGTLTVAGNMNMHDGSIYDWGLGDGVCDRIDVTGNLALDSTWTLRLNDEGAVQSTTPLRIFSYGGAGAVGNVNFDTSAVDALPNWYTDHMAIRHEAGAKEVYLDGLLVVGPATGSLTWDSCDDEWSDLATHGGSQSHWTGGAADQIPDVATEATVNSGKASVGTVDAATHTLNLTGGEVEVATGRTLAVTDKANVTGGTLDVDGTLNVGVAINVNSGGTLDTAGTLWTRNMNVEAGGTVTAGGTADMTVDNLTVSDTGSMNTGAADVTIGEQMELGPTTYSIDTGNTFKAGGAIDSTSAERLTLTGGVLSIGPHPHPTGNLTAKWNFEDGSGTTAVNANAPGTRDGTLQNMDDGDWVVGISGGGLDLDGGNDHIRIEGYKGITGSNDRTVSAWIKTVDQTGSIISWGQDQGGKKWIFRTQNDNGTNGAIRIEVNGGYIVGKTNVADGDWHHVAAVLPDGVGNVKNVRLYVDGQYDGSSAKQGKGISTASSAVVKIGTGHANRYLNGLIDEVFLYNRELEADEIYDLYLNALGDPLPLGSTDVLVTATSTLNVETKYDADFGSLTIESGTLTTTGPAGGMTFAGTTIAPGATAVGFQSDVLTRLGPLDGGGNTVTITTTGGNTLLLDQPGSNLENTTLKIQNDRTTVVHDGSPNSPIAGAAVQLDGGKLVLSAGTTGAHVAFDNPVSVTEDSTLNASDSGDLGAEGPATVDLGSPANGLSISAGKTLTTRSYDDYTLNYLGEVSGPDGGISVTGGTVNLAGGGTIGRLEVPAGTTAGAADLAVTDTMTLDETTYSVSGGQFKVSGTDLAVKPDVLTLQGGTLTITDAHPHPTGNLTAKWTFEDGSGTTAVNANSPGTRDGTLKNMNNADWVDGKVGGGLDLDGSNDHIRIEGYKGVTGSNDRTVAAWIKTNDNTGSIISWGKDSKGDKWIFRTDGGDLRVEVNDGYIVGNTDVADGQWHHVAAVLPDGVTNVNNVRLFVDGQYDGYSSRLGEGVTTASSAVVKIGTGHSNRYLDGIIDEVFLYNRGLSDTEIEDLYLNALGDPLLLETTEVRVTADSTLDPVSSGQASFGTLTMEDNSILALSGTAPSIDFGGVTGEGTIAGDFSVRDTLAPGDEIGALAVDGSLTLNSGVIYEWELLRATSSDTVSVSGDLTLDDWTLQLAGAAPGAFARPTDKFYLFTGYDQLLGSWTPSGIPGDYIDTSLVDGDSYWFTENVVIDVDGGGVYLTGLTYVPEPSTLAIWTLGLLGLAFCARRRRKVRSLNGPQTAKS